jgi:type 1 glutamine amidotransferase
MTWFRTVTRAFTLIAAIVAVGGGRGVMAAGPEPLRIHMISGVKEYKSAESLPAWADRLERRYGVQCTLSMGTDYAKKLDKLNKLKQADLLVLFCRRLKLNEESWQKIRAYLDSKGPILGIRTASHAFDKNMPNFDVDVLGGNYQGHYGAREAVAVEVPESARQHPILKGVTPWSRPGKLYKSRDLADTTQVLLYGQAAGQKEPLAWTNTASERRVFYTSMGLAGDFQDNRFLRLLENGIEWTTQRALTVKNGATETKPKHKEDE